MPYHLPLNCISCNKEIQKALYDDRFLPNLGTMLIGFMVIAAVIIVLSVLAFRRYERSRTGDGALLNPVPLTTTGLILGIGVGGFIDGILLHQILQWHNMLSNRIAPDTVVGKAVNMFWDGIFHAFTLIAVIIGIASLARLLRRPEINPAPQLMYGGMLAGWGLFNLVEGLIHHQILKLHNVMEFTPDPDPWNYGFLASGVLFMLIGTRIVYAKRYYPVRLKDR